jgi:hypothetical protein
MPHRLAGQLNNNEEKKRVAMFVVSNRPRVYRVAGSAAFVFAMISLGMV